MTRRAFAGCWAKLDHAKTHIDLLRTEIEKAGAPDPYAIPLRREYDPQEGAVVYRIDRMIEIRDDWPLIFGDAIHDLRGALDHLMWQLAIRYLGRTPTKAEVRYIQFPEVRPLRDFTGNRYLRFVQPADIDRLKPFQPYKRLGKGNLHPLPKLISLSNTDKHRRLHLLVVIPQSATLTNRPETFRDCVSVFRLMPDGKTLATVEMIAPRRNIRVNDIVARIFVQPTGPNPDVDFDMRLTGYVGTGRLGPVVPLLEGMAKYVAAVLSEFDPPR
jgi:hypothetical protein